MGESTDILVVGGGPGGLACATLLAQQGAKVVLVERKARHRSQGLCRRYHLARPD